MSDLKLVSFEANNSGIYPLPFDALAADIRIFSEGCQDNEFVSGDFIVESDGAGGQQVRITKTHDGTIWIASDPDTGIQLTKFGVSLLPDLNGWFSRLAQRLAFLEHRIDGAIGSDVGCDGQDIIDRIDEDIEGVSDRVTSLSGDVSEIDDQLPNFLPRPYPGATINPGPDCTVLGWRDGKLVNMPPEALFAAKIKVTPPPTITACDLHNGVVFGPPVYLDPVACSDLPETPELPEGDPCEVFPDAPVGLDHGQISTGVTRVQSFTKPEADEPWQICAYVPLDFGPAPIMR